MGDYEKIRDRLWNAEVSPKSYEGDAEKYQSAVLEQYKLYVEMADRISNRRGLTNTFFLMLNTGIFTVIAVSWKDRPAISPWGPWRYHWSSPSDSAPPGGGSCAPTANSTLPNTVSLVHWKSASQPQYTGAPNGLPLERAKTGVGICRSAISSNGCQSCSRWCIYQDLPLRSLHEIDDADLYHAGDWPLCGPR